MAAKPSYEQTRYEALMNPTWIPKDDVVALIAEAQLMLDRVELAPAVALARRALAAADAMLMTAIAACR